MNIKTYKITSNDDLLQCLEIRKIVFIQGQHVPANEEIDGKDNTSQHYLLKVDDQAAGTARVRFIDYYAKIERVAILDEYQGRGLGKVLMVKIMSDLQDQKNVKAAKLSSQTYAIPFYEKLGFTVCSEEYLDANIPHKDMILNLN